VVGPKGRTEALARRWRLAPAARTPAAPAPGALGRTVYTLRVQTGCDESCSYCIVPATRGPGRSMPPGRVVDEVEGIAAAGFREMMLAGVHLGSYGRDLTPRSSLGALLAALERRVGRGGPLVRVGSIEPMDVTPAVEERLAGSPAFAPHFHLPLQHGSNRVLRAMRRPYTVERYMALVERLRHRSPSAAVGADVIVGFPGERDEDARALAACLRDSPLSYLHVFRYSERPGTEAAGLPGRVPGPVARERLEAVHAIGRRLSARFRASQVGAVRDGLTTGDGSVVLTDNYLKVRVAGGSRPNRRVRVRIIGDGTPMSGEIVPGSAARQA
jgi:threonylcarbamoyladenosine tRNA methylthiotransferase MtaB